MATKMCSFPLDALGVIFPMISIPHVENVQGEVMVYNSLVFRWEVLQISMELRLLTMSHERSTVFIPRNILASGSY